MARSHAAPWHQVASKDSPARREQMVASPSPDRQPFCVGTDGHRHESAVGELEHRRLVKTSAAAL